MARNQPQKSWHELSVAAKAAVVAVLGVGGVIVLAVFSAIIGGTGGTGSQPVAPLAAQPIIAAPTTSSVPVAPLMMPNVVGMTFSRAIGVLAGAYPQSHPQMDPPTAPYDAAIASQEPAAGTPLEPVDGTVTLHMAGGTPPTSTITPTEETPGSDSSGGSVDLPHIPHPHAHVCVGGRHVHVCS